MNKLSLLTRLTRRNRATGRTRPSSRTASRATGWLAAIALVLTTVHLAAHTTGENYVFIDVEDTVITGRFEIHFNDLEQKLGIAADKKNIEAARETVSETAPRVKQYILDHFSIGPSDDAPYEIQFTKDDVMDLKFAQFAQYFFEIPITEVPEKLVIHHEMLYENDRFHRGLLVITGNARTNTEYPPEHAAMVFSRPTSRQELDLTGEIGGLMPSKAFIWQGILHIWIGIDHILFLVVLLLPAVLRRENGKWVPADSLGSAAWNIVKIVTIFTIAHSITLSLAALDFISLPARLIESVIAASIILVAANNVFPRFKEGSALIIFFFGLFHGMGFASVMGELPFRVNQLVKVLICFNVGVEIGQLAIVIGAFLVLFALRRARAYRPIFLYGGSVAASVVGLFWLVERAFAL